MSIDGPIWKEPPPPPPPSPAELASFFFDLVKGEFKKLRRAVQKSIISLNELNDHRLKLRKYFSSLSLYQFHLSRVKAVEFSKLRFLIPALFASAKRLSQALAKFLKTSAEKPGALVTMQDQPTLGLQSLSPELLPLILQSLAFADIANLRRVSRRMKAVVDFSPIPKISNLRFFSSKPCSPKKRLIVKCEDVQSACLQTRIREAGDKFKNGDHARYEPSVKEVWDLMVRSSKGPGRRR